MVTSGSDPSGMKVWVTPPSKTSRLAEMVADDTENLKYRVEGGNNYLVMLRPVTAAGDTVHHTKLPLLSIPPGRERGPPEFWRSYCLNMYKQVDDMNKNEDTKFQNLPDAAKGVLRGKCIAINTYNNKGIKRGV